MRNMTLNILPDSAQWGAAFSPNENLLVTCGTNRAHYYSRSGNALTRAGYFDIYTYGYDAIFSPDGTKLVLLYNTGTVLNMNIYTVSGTTITIAVSAQAVVTEGGNYYAGGAFSPDGSMFVVAHHASPYVTRFSVSGTTFTKLSNPATLPPAASNGVAFSADGTKLAVAHGSGITMYSVGGTTFTSATGPTGLGESMACAFSDDGTLFAVACTASPYINIYSVSGTTYTKLSNPSTLPTNTAMDCKFSHDGAKLFVAHAGSPYITTYGISGTTFTKQTNPTTIPASQGNAIAISANNTYLAVTSTGSSYINAYNLTADELPQKPTIISPSSIYVDVSIAQTFEWQHNISSGTAQTQADLQTSTDGVTWVGLATVSGSSQNASITAGTLPSGGFQWRARTYNQSAEYGDWSDASSLVGIGKPNTPVIDSVTTTPRPTVVWQSAGQQAYEVAFGTVDSGIKFGTAKTFVCPEYLADGTYDVNVRVQNSSGLWSDWATSSVTVSNTAGNAITLTVTASHVASLSWTTTGSYDKYYVYRNGELIAKTTVKNYVDNTSIGSTVYQVRGAYNANDNYGLSSEVTADIKCETVMISDVVSPSWITLIKTATSDRVNPVSESGKASYMYFAGSEYPSVEISEFKSKKIGFEAAFIDIASAATFSQLRGKIVCVKDQWNNMVIGVLIGFSKSSARFYQSFTCEVEQIAYNEVIAHD